MRLATWQQRESPSTTVDYTAAYLSAQHNALAMCDILKARLLAHGERLQDDHVTADHVTMLNNLTARLAALKTRIDAK